MQLTLNHLVKVTNFKSYYLTILSSKVFFYLKLKIFIITTEPIWFSTLGNIHTGPVMILSYSSFRLKS